MTAVSNQHSLHSLAGRKVALTGAGGFIGGHLARQLAGLGAEVVPLPGDVRDRRSFDGDFDLLFHLATALPAAFAADPEGAEAVNVEGARNALEACRRNGARLVFTSTCGVYRQDVAGPIPEQAPLADASRLSPYARSKLAAETLCRENAERGTLAVAIVRLFNVYGPGQRGAFLVPYLLDCAYHGRPAVIRTPDSRRDMLYVDDAVRGLTCAGLSRDNRLVVHLGKGEAIAVREVVTAFEAVLGRSIAKSMGGEDDPVPVSWADVSVARSQLGWQPAIDIGEGLRLTLAGHHGGRNGSAQAGGSIDE